MEDKELTQEEKYKNFIKKFAEQKGVTIDEAEKMKICKEIKREYLGEDVLEMDGRWRL